MAANMSMKPADLYNAYQNSLKSPITIKGRTIYITPKDIGPEKTFFNGQEMIDSIEKGLSPSSGNEVYISCGPGEYDDITFTQNDYIKVTLEDPTRTTGINTGDDGYSITGNTLTVTSVGGAGDRFATVQEAYDAVANDYILGTPLRTDSKFVKFSNNDFAEGYLLPGAAVDAGGGIVNIVTQSSLSEFNLTTGDTIKLVDFSGGSYGGIYEITVVDDYTFSIEATYVASTLVYPIKPAILITNHTYVGIVIDDTALNMVVS